MHEFLDNLDNWWFPLKDRISTILENELVIIARNISTAPQEVPLAFWSFVFIISFILLNKWRKR